MTARKSADLSKVLGVRQASIMEYLWNHGPQSVAGLHQGLASREPLAYTTVFTELSRMLKKGLVGKSGDGGSHLDVRYNARLSREELIASVVADTLGVLIAAHGPAAVHGFVDALAVDPALLKELRRVLEINGRRKQ